MIVSISAITFDIDGFVTIETQADNTNGITQRRVNRVATLDGGVAINDSGYSEGDRNLQFTWRTKSPEHSRSVERMVMLYPLVNVSTSEGFYLAAPSSFEPGSDVSTVSFLVQEKLA